VRDQTKVERHDHLKVDSHNLRRVDAETNVFFARELEHVASRISEVMHPEHKARTIVPADPDMGPAWADTYTYRTLEKFGEAKIIRSGAATDLPRADVGGDEVPTKVYQIGDSFGYTVDELMKSQALNRGLDTLRASAAQFAANELCDTLIATGDADIGFTGFINDAAVNVESPTLGTTWATKIATPALVEGVLDDVNLLIAEMSLATAGVLKPDTLVLPEAQFTTLSTKRLPESSETLLSFLMRSSPYITQIFGWHKLTAAGAGGLDRMVAFRRDPAIVSYVTPMEWTMLAPQEQGLEIVVPAWMKCAGTVIRHPLGLQYMDGI